jgi:hypothetical protein
MYDVEPRLRGLFATLHPCVQTEVTVVPEESILK